MREFNAILGSCGVSRTAQSFFESEPVDADLSCSAFDAWALDEAEVDFGQSLVTCLEAPQKRQSLLSRQCCLSWGVSFPSLPSLEDRSGVVGFCLVVEPLFWVEPELVFFCFECEEPFLDLLSDLLESDFGLDLFPEDPDAQVSWETSPHHSQYHASMACTGFLRLDNVFSLSWWTMSSLICLASPL